MLKRVPFLVLIAVVILNGTGLSQTACGDVNGNGEVTVLDMAAVIDHIMYKHDYDVWPELDAGDVDGYTGVTIADAVRMADYLFAGGQPVTCNPTLTYTLTRTETDTLWVSVMNNIPDGIDRVILPLRTTLQSNTNGIEINAIPLDPPSLRKFKLTEITTLNPDPFVLTSSDLIGDTCVITMIDIQSDGLGGTQEILGFVYDRVAPGLGSASVYYFYGQHDVRRVAVEKNGDLFEPRFMTVEFGLPPDTLVATVPTLNFATKTGVPITTTSDLEISSAYGDITFTLTPSESWISLPSPPPGGWTTPATIPVGVNISGLLDGSYAGSISVSVTDPIEAINTVSDIPVTLLITPPVTIPFGDLTCDGKISVADIARLIDLLFVSGAPLAECQ